MEKSDLFQQTLPNPSNEFSIRFVGFRGKFDGQSEKKLQIGDGVQTIQGGIGQQFLHE